MAPKFRTKPEKPLRTSPTSSASKSPRRRTRCGTPPTNWAYANFDGYFRGDNETIPLASGRRVLVVSMWTKTSLANIVAKAAEHGIVVAEEADKAGADFSGKGFSLEYLGGVLLAGHVRRQRQGG